MADAQRREADFVYALNNPHRDARDKSQNLFDWSAIDGVNRAQALKGLNDFLRKPPAPVKVRRCRLTSG